MPKFMLLLATQKGLAVLLSIVRAKRRDIVGCVLTFEEKYSIDYEKDIEKVCLEFKIPHYHYGGNSGDKLLVSLVEKYTITNIVAIGWRYLLPLSLNKILVNPIIIFHDSLLPKYRGFAPTPTAIICGEKMVGVSILYAASGVDEGEIIWQKGISVSQKDYIKDIIEKQAKMYVEGFEFIFKQIVKGVLESYPQDESKAIYSIWRSPEDCKINWEKDAQEIFNLVRAVSSPYIGAFTYYKNRKIIIQKANIVPDLTFAIRDCGKIWSIKENYPTVICGKGLLQIVDAEDELGNQVMFDSVRCKLGRKCMHMEEA